MEEAPLAAEPSLVAAEVRRRRSSPQSSTLFWTSRSLLRAMGLSASTSPSPIPRPRLGDSSVHRRSSSMFDVH
jgi:hypothetical protein